MQIQIEHTAHADADTIFALYDDAIAYQKQVGNNHWLGFAAELVAAEITDRRHYKVLSNGGIAGTFCLTFGDPEIWKELNNTPAIYIHRIAAGQQYRGLNLVKHIVKWAKEYALNNNLSLVRMDTGSGNYRLINYYISCGFTYLGDTTIEYKPNMPAHYENGSFALLEMWVEK